MENTSFRQSIADTAFWERGPKQILDDLDGCEGNTSEKNMISVRISHINPLKLTDFRKSERLAVQVAARAVDTPSPTLVQTHGQLSCDTAGQHLFKPRR